MQTAPDKTQHTPGPWVTSDAFGPNPNGRCVQSAGDCFMICSCTGYYGREGAQANARLIAAAPELLEACRLFVKYDEADPLDDVGAMFRYSEALKATKEAINKAAGAQP